MNQYKLGTIYIYVLITYGTSYIIKTNIFFTI
jgi:hypothetical protein